MERHPARLPSPHAGRAHREALRAVVAAYLANNPGYYGYGYEATIHLDDLGPSLWHLLAQADEAGLELVPTKASAGAVTVVGPASISLDLRRAGQSTSATLGPVVTICGHTLGAASVEFLGDPLQDCS